MSSDRFLRYLSAHQGGSVLDERNRFLVGLAAPSIAERPQRRRRIPWRHVAREKQHLSGTEGVRVLWSRLCSDSRSSLSSHAAWRFGANCSNATLRGNVVLRKKSRGDACQASCGRSSGVRSPTSTSSKTWVVRWSADNSREKVKIVRADSSDDKHEEHLERDGRRDERSTSMIWITWWRGTFATSETVDVDVAACTWRPSTGLQRRLTSEGPRESGAHPTADSRWTARAYVGGHTWPTGASSTLPPQEQAKSAAVAMCDDDFST